MILFQKAKFKNVLSFGNKITEFDFTTSKKSVIAAANGKGKCLHPLTKIKVNVYDNDASEDLEIFLKTKRK